MNCDTEKFEVKFRRDNVCLRLADSADDEGVKNGELDVRKGAFGYTLTWTPNDDGDRDLAISFNLNDLYSFTRVVPFGGTASFIVFRLKNGESCLPLEFHGGGTRELVRSFQGLLTYKRSEHNQNEYIVCETSPEVVTQAMEGLNLFEGASLEHSLSYTSPQSSFTYTPSVRAEMNGKSVLWKQANSRAKEGVRYVGKLMRGLVSERSRMSEAEIELAVAQLREEDTSLPVVSRQDCGFEVLSKIDDVLTLEGSTKSSLPTISRPAVQRSHPLTPTEWASHQDPEGRITCVDTILERIFRGGVENNLRPEVWKYLLDYYKWNSTASENKHLAEKRKDEYYAMKYQWRSMIDEQLKRNAIVRDRKLQIEKDVRRTDRTLDFFRDEDGENIQMLSDILTTYTMYNFDLGYVQGMNDLLSPILMLLPTEHDAFWCFAGLMDRMEHNFEMDQAGMKQQLQQLSSLTQTLDEELFDHLESADSQNMYFCFRWLLLQFKREFNVADSMRMYEVLWTGYPCPNFHLLVAMAILDMERSTILSLKPDLTEILKHINEMALKIDVERALSVAESIYRQMQKCDDLPDDIIDIFGLGNDTPSLISTTS